MTNKRYVIVKLVEKIIWKNYLLKFSLNYITHFRSLLYAFKMNSAINLKLVNFTNPTHI